MPPQGAAFRQDPPLVIKIRFASKDLLATNTLAYLAPPTIRKIHENP
jgi:hypothetical protein